MPAFLTGLIIGFFVGVIVTAVVAIVAIKESKEDIPEWVKKEMYEN